MFSDPYTTEHKKYISDAYYLLDTDKNLFIAADVSMTGISEYQNTILLNVTDLAKKDAGNEKLFHREATDLLTDEIMCSENISKLSPSDVLTIQKAQIRLLV